MKINKDDVVAIIGTVVLHLLLFLFLYFRVLKAFIPIDNGGIPVTFSELYTTVGVYVPSTPPPAALQPQRQTPTAVTQQRQTTARTNTTPARTSNTPPARTTATTQPITQNKVETVSIPESEKTETKPVVDEQAQREKEEAERLRREEAERQRQAEEIRKQQEAINDRINNAFNNNAGQSTNSQGSGSNGTNFQGNPSGNSSAGQNSGSRGILNLTGRYFVESPTPSYSENAEGTIVINIIVSPEGKVINATIGQGTKGIVNESIRTSAVNAAYKSTVNPVSGTTNQSGTITYNYRLN